MSELDLAPTASAEDTGAAPTDGGSTAEGGSAGGDIPVTADPVEAEAAADHSPMTELTGDEVLAARDTDATRADAPSDDNPPDTGPPPDTDATRADAPSDDDPPDANPPPDTGRPLEQPDSALPEPLEPPDVEADGTGAVSADSPAADLAEPEAPDQPLQHADDQSVAAEDLVQPENQTDRQEAAIPTSFGDAQVDGDPDIESPKFAEDAETATDEAPPDRIGNNYEPSDELVETIAAENGDGSVEPAGSGVQAPSEVQNEPIDENTYLTPAGQGVAGTADLQAFAGDVSGGAEAAAELVGEKAAPVETTASVEALPAQHPVISEATGNAEGIGAGIAVAVLGVGLVRLLGDATGRSR